MSSFSAAATQPRSGSARPIVDFQQLVSAAQRQSPNTNVILYRLPQVLARIPVSRSAWFAGIRSGRYPRGYSLGPRTTVWRSDDIDQIVLQLAHAQMEAAHANNAQRA
jgi:prophage regulatory protein